MDCSQLIPSNLHLALADVYSAIQINTFTTQSSCAYRHLSIIGAKYLNGDIFHHTTYMGFTTIVRTVDVVIVGRNLGKNRSKQTTTEG
jgi:broad specificity polyphosphatase/5'/3'-nucleotidase SurE